MQNSAATGHGPPITVRMLCETGWTRPVVSALLPSNGADWQQKAVTMTAIGRSRLHALNPHAFTLLHDLHVLHGQSTLRTFTPSPSPFWSNLVNLKMFFAISLNPPPRGGTINTDLFERTDHLEAGNLSPC